MDQIRNFVQLTDHVGTAGQPTRGQFDLLAEAGYRHVVNIGMPDHPDAVADEGDIVTRLGLTYVHIPVPFDAPRPVHLRDFCRVVEALWEDPLFIHCIMNHRVTAFMYHYLTKVMGYDEARARSPMFDVWEPDEVWTAVMAWSREDIGI
jgi:protein tyrosine phosphatase (PTP) superfamily phosphohydrolase (DUF442 family)